MNSRNPIDNMPGYHLDQWDMEYLYSLSKDEELSPEKFATSKSMAVDILMTNLVRAYKPEAQRMAADSIAPIKPVRSRTGTWKNRHKEGHDLFVDIGGSDSGQTHEIGQAVTESSYSTTIRKLKILVSDQEMMERGVLDPVQEATVLLKQAVDLDQEVNVYNLAVATTNTAAAGAVWNTGTTVHTDITAAKNAMESALGAPATHILFGSNVANEILANAALEQGVFTSTALPKGATAMEAIDWAKFPANPWGLKTIIPNVHYNSATDPVDTTLTRIWNADAYLFHIDKSARSMGWAVQQELQKPTIVRWRDEDRGGWYYKIIAQRDQNAVTPEAVYKITTVT